MPESNTPISNPLDPNFNSSEYENTDDVPLSVEVANHHGRRFDEFQIIKICQKVLLDHGYSNGEISIAIVDDPKIHELNNRYLQHDFPTDVLSFPLARNSDKGFIQGEIIVSADTAANHAAELAIGVADELSLYVLHGVLHLVGYGDKNPEQRSEMRLAEKQYAKQFEIEYSNPDVQFLPDSGEEQK